MDKIELPLGTDAVYKQTLKTESQTPSAGFTLADTPSSQVWSGRDLAAVFSPTATWIDPDEPSIGIAFSAAMTADLAPGRYYLRTVITTSGGLRLPTPDCEVILVGSPGTAEPPATVVTYQDVTRYAPWLESQSTVENEAGYLDERGAAHAYVLRVILTRYRDWYERARVYEGWSGSAPTPDQMETLLDDGTSLVIDDRLKEIEARYTIGLICENALSPSAKDNPFQQIGLYNKQVSHRLMDGLEVRVVNADLDMWLGEKRVRSKTGSFSNWGGW